MTDSFPLHECVFNGDTRKLSLLLRTHEIAEKDKHGKWKLYQLLHVDRNESQRLESQIACSAVLAEGDKRDVIIVFMHR